MVYRTHTSVPPTPSPFQVPYQYDDNRRVELDRVTSFGSSGIVDDTVKSIGRTYDTLGRTTHVTSYSTNNGTGTPLNQLAYSFDSYGMLTETDQEHDGAVDGSTLSVQYGYSSTASGNIFTNGLRQETIKSPWHQANSKYLRLYYGASGSATESRFDRLHQVSGQFEQSGSYPIADDYRYAGTNRLWTARTRWANGGANQLYLHYDGAALGDTTRGYDRFGQVIGHSTSGSAGASSFAYTYDYAGNRLTRDAITSTNNVWDQKYAYDDLLRLATSDQGTLSSGSISSPTFEEDYALDQLGNWQSLVKKSGGSTTLDQNRTHNEANETGTIGASTGTNWADPVHDHAGNMTTMPQPGSPGTGYTAIYDAWNRMVEVKDGGTTIQTNQYDALHRRIVRDESGGGGAVRHFYYNERWQCVEERDGSYAFVKRHFWHPYYIDALAASIDSTGERLSFVHDANFNVTMAVDDTWNAATVIERYHYSPYGEVTYLNPDFSVKGTQESDAGNEFLYTGRRLDPGTGLYYYRNRFYHAQLGRFVNRDPIGYRGGMNLYGYVGGRVANYVDPSGLRWTIHDEEYFHPPGWRLPPTPPVAVGTYPDGKTVYQRPDGTCYVEGRLWNTDVPCPNTKPGPYKKKTTWYEKRAWDQGRRSAPRANVYVSIEVDTSGCESCDKSCKGTVDLTLKIVAKAVAIDDRNDWRVGNGLDLWVDGNRTGDQMQFLIGPDGSEIDHTLQGNASIGSVPCSGGALRGQGRVSHLLVDYSIKVESCGKVTVEYLNLSLRKSDKEHELR